MALLGDLEAFNKRNAQALPSVDGALPLLHLVKVVPRLLRGSRFEGAREEGFAALRGHSEVWIGQSRNFSAKNKKSNPGK